MGELEEQLAAANEAVSDKGLRANSELSKKVNALEEQVRKLSSERDALAKQMATTKAELDKELSPAPRIGATTKKSLRLANEAGEELLKVLSAIDVGVNRSRYVELLQEAQFAIQKYSAKLSDDEQQTYPLQLFNKCIRHLSSAEDAWSTKIKFSIYNSSDAKTIVERCEVELHENWKLARLRYEAARHVLKSLEAANESSP